jgi:hypothetical protein
MKSVSLFLFSLLILLSSCTGKKDESRVDQDAITGEIRATLAALSDSLRSDGLPGWISFLDNSPEFKWVDVGSSVSYDSLLDRLRYAKQYFRSSTISWDSVRIQPLTQNEATLFAIYTDTTVFRSGQQVIMPMDLTANLHRINGAWKFHSADIAEHDRWRGYQQVAFADTSMQLVQIIDSLIKANLGSTYRAEDFVDVDDRVTNGPYRVYQAMGSIFEDPHHQLQHSFLVVVSGHDPHGNALDSGSVAIIRDQKVIWRSRPLIPNVNFAKLDGFADLNNDGTTDILLCTPADMRGYSENLWIISPDFSGGRLLNKVDEYGESTIMGASNTFEFTQPNPKGVKVIKASIVGEHLNRHFTYTWNGSVFVKAKSTRSAAGH